MQVRNRGFVSTERFDFHPEEITVLQSIFPCLTSFLFGYTKPYLPR